MHRKDCKRNLIRLTIMILYVLEIKGLSKNTNGYKN
jgi:hypothetical protein